MPAHSIEQYERRRKCWLRGCREERDGSQPFCEAHTAALPADMLHRIQWAYDEGETMDWLAAISSAVQYLKD